MVTKFKKIIVPSDEIHIVNTGKGQFLHTSVKNPSYWLTPWKQVYKLPTKPISIPLMIPVRYSEKLELTLEMDIMVKLKDPDLAVKSLGGDIKLLKKTVEGALTTTIKQAISKYPIEDMLGFYSNLTREGHESLNALVYELGFSVISYDIANIHRKVGYAASSPTPQIRAGDNGGDNPPYTITGETQKALAAPDCRDNGGDVKPQSDLPMLPPGNAGDQIGNQYPVQPGQPYPAVQQAPGEEYWEQDNQAPIPQENPQYFNTPTPAQEAGISGHLAYPSSEEINTLEEKKYNEDRNQVIKSAFDNFQYARDDLKWGDSNEGQATPETGASLLPTEPGFAAEYTEASYSSPQIVSDDASAVAGQNEASIGEQKYLPVESSSAVPPGEGSIIVSPSFPSTEYATPVPVGQNSPEYNEEEPQDMEVWDWKGQEDGTNGMDYRKKAEGVIREIKGVISRIKQKGMVLPPSPINTYLTNVTTMIESGQYLDATKIGRECLTYLEETEVLFETVRDEVIQLQEQISLLKDGKVPIDEEEITFNRVVDLFKKAEYEEAKEAGMACRKLLENKSSLFEEADKAIKEAWQLMKHAAPLGWEITKANALLDDAKTSAENQEYKDALDKANLARDVIQTHFDSLKGIWGKIRDLGEVATKAHKDSLVDIQESLDKFGEKMDEILTLGVKITPELNDELTDVEDALSRNDIYGAKHLIDDLESTIDGLKKQHERARLKFERALLLIEETKRTTNDIRPMMYIVWEMEEVLKSGDYELVSELGDELEDACRARERDDSMLAALNMMESAGRIAEECKELGMDVIDVDPLLRDGIISFRQDNFQRASSKSELAYKILLEAKARYLVISTRRIIETTDAEMTGPKDALLSELEDVEWILDRGEPDTAMDKLRTMRLSIFEKKFLERLRSAEGMLRWLEEKDIDLEDERKLVIRAKLSFNEQDFKTATKIINVAIEELDGIEQYERIITEINNTAAIIEEMESKGLDVSAVKEKIAALKPIIDGDLEAKSNVTAMGFVQECKQMALDIKKGYEIKKKVTFLEKKLSKLEMEGVSAPSIWRLIQKVYKSLGDGDIRKANSLVERVDSRIDEEVELFNKDRSLKLKEYKKSAVKRFKEGNQRAALKYFNKALKIQPRDEKLLYNKAVVLKNMERYVEAIQYCNRALALNDEYEQAKRLRDSCRATLRNEGSVGGRYREPGMAYDFAPLRYAPQEDVGLDFKGIKNLITEIVADLKDQGGIDFSDFSIEDFPETENILERSNPLIEMMARDLLFNTKKLVENDDLELEISKEEIIEDLRRIDNLLEKGNLAVIIKELQKIRALLINRDGTDDILSTWKKIMETRKDKSRSGEFGEEEVEADIIEKTKPLYEEGDLSKAIEIMRNARREAESDAKVEMSENILRDLTEIDDLMVELAEKGVDVEAIKAELVLIKPAIEKKFYRRAEDYIERAYGVAEDLQRDLE